MSRFSSSSPESKNAFAGTNQSGISLYYSSTPIVSRKKKRPQTGTCKNTAPLLLLLQQALSLQILDNLPHTILHTLQITANMNLGILRRLIRRTDAREFRNLALPRLLVQTLGITRLGNLKREIDKDLDEGKGLVVARRHGVQVARLLAVFFVRRDEGCDCDGGRVGEELGDLYIEW